MARQFRVLIREQGSKVDTLSQVLRVRHKVYQYYKVDLNASASIVLNVIVPRHSCLSYQRKKTAECALFILRALSGGNNLVS